jgi:crossover junction endodeoxyribonuclease RuvC
MFLGVATSYLTSYRWLPLATGEKEQKMIIGMDPGLSGGLALVDNSGNIVCCQTMPAGETGVSGIELTRVLKNYMVLEHQKKRGVGAVDDGGLRAVVEQVGCMPGQGVCSVFTFGTGFGILQGVLSALEIPWELVRPQRWQKEVCAGIPGKDPKKRSLEAARRLWPSRTWLASERCRKPHDGMVDAALIAEYGRRLHLGRTAKAENAA